MGNLKKFPKNKIEENNMKRTKKIVAVLLMVCMIFSAIPFVTSAATDPYYQSLIDQGWPSRYAVKLMELHYAHPTWNFVMEDITGMNSAYTWDYIFNNEYYPEERNLIVKSYGDAQPVYRRNSNLYDSGLYPVSSACLSYFLDPVNFLNEDYIFMFEDLGYSDYMTEEVVEVVLSGTFMSHAVIPDAGNTLTYAQYFIQIAKELDISAIGIASRVKNEQGVNGDSPLISGACGTKINQLTGTSNYTQYNGYYNYFNIGASGNGYVEIYTNAMIEAVNGGWNTRMKAIRGGAEKLGSKYISDYQHTAYYQKFNIHPYSSRNFWGQYMQSIFGARSDAINYKKAYREGDLLDTPFTFCIPVISGNNSEHPNPGTYFTSSTSFITNLDEPSGGGTCSNEMSEASASVNLDDTDTFYLQGWSVHTSGISEFQYSFDGGEYRTLAGEYRSDVANATTSYTNCSTLNAFKMNIPIGHLSNGIHSLSVRAVCKDNNRYAVATVTLDVTAPNFTSTLDQPSGVTDSETGIFTASADVTLNDDITESTYYIAGWSVHEYGISRYEYSVDGGEYKSLESGFRQDVANAKPSYTECSDINAFGGHIDLSGCTEGESTVVIRGLTKRNTYYDIGTITLNITSPTYHCELDNPDGPGLWNHYTETTASVTVTDLAQTLFVSGWTVHSSDIMSFVYEIDNGGKLPFNGGYREDIGNHLPEYSFCTANAYGQDVVIGHLATGTHTLTVSALTGNNAYYKVAVITLNITSDITVYDNIVVESGSAVIDTTEGVITGIASGTSATQLLSTLSNGVITDENGNEITADNLASGYKLLGYADNGKLCEEYTIIVTGDVIGDGVVNAKDVIAAKLLKNGKNTGYSRAVDTNNDGVITSAELAAVSKIVAGI